MLDTPGYSDFSGDVKAALRVADTAVMVLKSAEGVEVGTENAARFASELNLPLALLINKVDNEHSNFSRTVQQGKDRITPNAIVITFPANEGLNFNTVIDIVSMKAYQYGDTGSKKVNVMDIPADLQSAADTYRTELIEKVAETTEELMNKYFEEGSLSNEDIETGLKIAVSKGNLSPVFALSSTKAVGVNNFLDFVSKYFPSPADKGGEEASLKDSKNKVLLKPDASGEVVLFIFKTISEQHVGELSLFKVFSGTATAGLDLINQNNGKTERLSQLSVLNGHTRTDVSKISAGDLGAVVKLKDTHTNNTLTSKKKPFCFSE